MEVNNLSLQLSRMVIRDAGFNKPPFAQTTSDEENKSRSSDNFWDEWSPALGHTTSNGDNQSFEQDITTLSDKTRNSRQNFPENCSTKDIPVLCVSSTLTAIPMRDQNSYEDGFDTPMPDQDSTSSKHIGKGVYKLVKKRQKVNIKDMKKYRRLPSKATAGGKPRKAEKQTVKRKRQVSTLPSKKGMRKGNTHCPKPSINEMRVGDVSINPPDLTCLDQNNWLDDKVIHAYLNLLQSEFNSSNERGCYVLSCFLESKWERKQYNSHSYHKIPLEELQYVLLPVCQQNHWFLLVANMTNKTVSVHDSIPSQTRNERFYRHWINFMAARRNRGQWSIGRNLSNRQVAARRNRSRWSVGRNLSNRQVAARRNRSQWSIGRNLSNRQTDNDSCGVFVLMNAEAILQKSTPSIMRQYHVHSYRKYVQKRIAESSPYNKHPRPCDLPFCSMMKIQ